MITRRVKTLRMIGRLGVYPEGIHPGQAEQIMRGKFRARVYRGSGGCEYSRRLINTTTMLFFWSVPFLGMAGIISDITAVSNQHRIVIKLLKKLKCKNS